MGRLAACVMLLAAACFAPHPPVGAQCANGQCPSGLECVASTNTCELPGTPGTVDAPEQPADAAIEDTPPTPDGRACFGTAFLTVCPVAMVTTPVAFVNATTIDTNTSPSCIAYTGTTNNLCVIAGTSVTISSALRAVGAKPLVVLATTGDITIDAAGSIDVASVSGSAGAGANPAACVAGTAATGQQGGPGGSFGGVGGRGADLASPNGPTAAAATATPVTALRGGCKGGNGAGQQIAQGGNGGGAVMLIAGATITLNGTINASGAGGSGAVTRSGGGGGGAGGMIAFDAEAVSIAAAARVYANGGAGGEGGTPNHNGRRGADVTVATAAAVGGDGQSNHGGAGGNGSANVGRNGRAGAIGEPCTGSGGNNGNGGGGGAGGGSAGIIRVLAATQTIAPGTLSPPAN